MKSSIKYCISIVLLLTCCFCSDEHEQEDDFGSLMKGFELYSWFDDTNWNYVITSGTNSVKTYEIIVNSEIVYAGEQQLKDALASFVKGEKLFWIGEDWLDSCWDTDKGNLCLPPSVIVDEIQQHCNSLGLNLSISN